MFIKLGLSECCHVDSLPDRLGKGTKKLPKTVTFRLKCEAKPKPPRNRMIISWLRKCLFQTAKVPVSAFETGTFAA